MQSGADITLKNRRNETALDIAKYSKKQKMLNIVNTCESQKSSSRETKANAKPEQLRNKRSSFVGLQSDDEDSSTHVERVKTAVSDVIKTTTDTARRVDDVTSGISRLETKYTDI